MRSADPIREDEWKPAGGCFVDDDSPRLALGEERKDVGSDIALHDLLPRLVSEKEDACGQSSGEPREPLPLWPLADEHEDQAWVARVCHCPNEHVMCLLGAEAGDGEDDHIVELGAQLGT